MKHALPLLALALVPLACAASDAAPPAAPTPAPAPAPAAPAPAPDPTPATAPTPAPAPAPAPAPTATCPPEGGVLFEIDHRADAGAKLATSATKLYGNGAVTHLETDPDGKPLALTTSCLAPDVVGPLQTQLKAAPWKVTKARMHCMAMSATFIVYQLNGKPVFTSRLCSGESLDAKSKAALDAAVAVLEPAPRP
jgi:hypothetical protein